MDKKKNSPRQITGEVSGLRKHLYKISEKKSSHCVARSAKIAP